MAAVRQSPSLWKSRLSPESQWELRGRAGVFQTRCMWLALVAVGPSRVGGVKAGGLSRREVSPAGVSEVVAGVCNSDLDAQLREPISAGSFDNSPGKELPL